MPLDSGAARESAGRGSMRATTVERAGFRVRAVPSAHEGLDTDAPGVIFTWGTWSRPRG